jgi:hypothetical protein
MPGVSSTGPQQNSHPGAAQSPAQIFAAKGLIQWWKYPTQRYGQNGEEGTDYSFGSFGAPIGAIAGGKVVYVGNGGYPGSSIGQIVQILLPNGQLMHYQHLQTANVRVGQVVGVGDVIGTLGGCPTGGYGSGLACTRFDQWSTGGHIEVRLSNGYNPTAPAPWNDGTWVDPHAKFLAIAGAPAVGGTPTGSTGASSTGASGSPAAAAAAAANALLATFLGPSFQLPKVSLAPTADITQVLWTMDEILLLVNPFDVQTAQIDTVALPGIATPSVGVGPLQVPSTTVAGGGSFSFVDPISWVEGFGFNLVADFSALILRSFLILLGVFICYKVASHFIDFGAVGENAGNAAASINAARLAMFAA